MYAYFQPKISVEQEEADIKEMIDKEYERREQEQNFKEVLDLMVELGVLDPKRILEKDYVISQVELFMDVKDMIDKKLKLNNENK